MSSLDCLKQNNIEKKPKKNKIWNLKNTVLWTISALLILWNSVDVLAAKKVSKKTKATTNISAIKVSKKTKANNDILSIYDKDIPNFQEIELQKAKNLEVQKQKFINELKKDWFDIIKTENWNFKLWYQNSILNFELQEFRDFELAINFKELTINLLQECWTNKSCKFKNNKGYWLDIYLDSGSFFKKDTEVLSHEDFLNQTRLAPGIIYTLYNTMPEYLIDEIVNFLNKIIESKK